MRRSSSTSSSTATRFAPELLAELLASAGNTVRVEGDRVVITPPLHRAPARPARPLPQRAPRRRRPRRRCSTTARRSATSQPPTSFPATSCSRTSASPATVGWSSTTTTSSALLVDCNFRELPAPRGDEEEAQAEPWFYVGENDIFPEEFLTLHRTSRARSARISWPPIASCLTPLLARTSRSGYGRGRSSTSSRTTPLPAPSTEPRGPGAEARRSRSDSSAKEESWLRASRPPPSSSKRRFHPPGSRSTIRDGRLQVPDHPIIPFIEGDGTGPRHLAGQRARARRRGRQGLRRPATHRVDGGLRRRRRRTTTAPTWLPDETVDAFREFLVGIKGPLTTPIGGGIRSLNVALRQILDLYVCLRPVRWFKGVPSPVKHPEKVDMVIFRENTEDIYAGIEFESGCGGREEGPRLPAEQLPAARTRRSASRRRPAIGIKPVSREGSERLVRAAIRYAIANRRKSVTLVHKGNIMKFTEGALPQLGLRPRRARVRRPDLDLGAQRADEARAGRGGRHRRRAKGAAGQGPRSRTPSPTSRSSKC